MAPNTPLSSSTSHPVSDPVLARLPPPWPHDPLPAIRAALDASGRKVVVLDDDPTGTQTVHDIPVLTEWSIEALARELATPGSAFYILTNSRSLPTDEAAALNEEIACNLTEAGRRAGRAFDVISRSDSTLRGHFPVEMETLARHLGLASATWLLIPFFEAGGRVTVDNIHYVIDGGRLVPAGETAFARDAAFGYRASNLLEWVSEKTAGRIPAHRVASISIDDLRRGGPERVCSRLLELAGTPVCVVNATVHRDVEVFVHGLLAAEARGGRFLCRTAASFVAARAGLQIRPLLRATDLGLPSDDGPGFVIAGSYVPRSTEQIARLRVMADVVAVEMSVPLLLDDATREAEVCRVHQAVDLALAGGWTTLLYTSRHLVTGNDATQSLAIGNRISDALVAVTRRIRTRLRYLIAKGGITSSDIATRGLDVKRAIVRGQIHPGVPVWELGPESRHPGLVYVVFPGNVGGPEALAEVVSRLEAPRKR